MDVGKGDGSSLRNMQRRQYPDFSFREGFPKGGHVTRVSIGHIRSLQMEVVQSVVLSIADAAFPADGEEGFDFG